MKKKHIGLLIIFLLSLLINPVSAYSKTAPYCDIPLQGAANWGGTDIEFIQSGHDYRIRQNGTVYQIRFAVANVSNLEEFYFTIWRKNESSGYDRVGITGDLTSYISNNGINTINLPNPIEGVQEGDYYGARIKVSGNALYVNEYGTRIIYSVNNSTSNITNFNWEGQLYSIGSTFVIESFMENPYMVFIGDSIISGHTEHYSFIEFYNYDDPKNIYSTIEIHWSKKVDRTYQNMGIGGQRTGAISGRFESDVIELSPEFVLIEGGVNDVNSHNTQLTVETICNNWEDMIDEAIDGGVTPVIMLILPENDHSPEKDYGTDADLMKIDNVNEGLISLAAQYPPSIIVDARSYVGIERSSGPDGNYWDINPIYDSGDGIHFNASGHERIAQAIKDSFIYLYREPGLYNIVQSDGTVIYSKSLVGTDNTSCRMNSTNGIANVSFNEPSSEELVDFTIISGTIDWLSMDNLPSDYVCNLRNSDATLIENRTAQNGIVYFTEDIGPGSYYVDYNNSDTTPPASITQLHNTTYEQTYINWTWTDPVDTDFSHVMIYLNGTFGENVSTGIQFYNATGLNSSTEYQIGTHTVNTAGIINETWVNSTARTNQSQDNTPPASITGLHNTTYEETYINWTWTDPVDTDFLHVMIYLNGTFKANVSSGIQFYNATGLNSSTEYQISTHTVDTTGIINETWVNSTARTSPDTTPPASITQLHNTTYEQTYINWTWTDPIDTDFSYIMVYLNGTFETNVSTGIQFYNATELNSSTEYQISTHTVDTAGIINETWVNSTARTSPDNTPPIIITATANPYTIEANGTENTLLNVTAVDISGIASVTINLSSLNGSLYQDMVNNNGIWQYTINTTTIDDFNLPINVTDNANNSNTSVSIPMRANDSVSPVISNPVDKPVEQCIDQCIPEYITWNITEIHPGMYRVLRNGTQVVPPTSYASDVNFIVRIDTNISGIWNYTIIANDTSKNTASDQVNITVRDTTAPIITGPEDHLIEQNATGNITWNIIDANPAEYRILRNGTQIDNATFIHSDNIVKEINSTILGIWNYTIIANDTLGNISSDQINITVRETIPPVISSPPDQTIERTDIGEISWTITDRTPNKYQVLRNGTQVEPPTSYSSGEEITIELNTETVGIWNYTIVANDTSGNITTDQANITIEEKRKISICITSPGHESDTTSMTIIVNGTVDGNGSNLIVLVNGKVADLNLTGYIGTFSASDIPLTDGTNEITARVTNEMNEEISDYIKVIRRKETPRSSGGGSSGGGSSSEDHANIFISETKREFISMDEIICYHFESEGNIVEYVNFTSKKTAGKVPARIEILNHTSSLVNYAPVDIVYKNLNIWVGNLGWATEKNIDNVSVSFKLERSWITHNNIDITTIEMNRYNSGKWNPLTTSLIRQDDTYMYFEAKTPGFSPFVITGKQGYIGNPNKPGDEGITATPTDVIDTTNEVVDTPDLTLTRDENRTPGFNLFAGLLIFLIIVLFIKRKTIS